MAGRICLGNCCTSQQVWQWQVKQRPPQKLTCFWVLCKYGLLQMLHCYIISILPPALKPVLLILHHLLCKCHVALMHLLPYRHLPPCAHWLYRGELTHCQLYTAEQLMTPVDGTCTMYMADNASQQLLVPLADRYKQL